MSTHTAPLASDARPGIGRIAMRLIWFTLRFAIFGPIAGYLVLWFFASIVMFPWNAASRGIDEALSLIVISLIGFFLLIFPVVIAYALTIAPAALTGLVSGVLSLVAPHPLAYYPGTALAGFVTTYIHTQQYTQWSQSGSFWYGAIGAAAGLICAWRARRRMALGAKIYGIPVTL